jgi:hypothetical protein
MIEPANHGIKENSYQAIIERLVLGHQYGYNAYKRQAQNPTIKASRLSNK